MLTKVISGGQTGADQAGLRAATACGLETGGWMPRGFKTEDWPRPEFAILYGIREHPSPEYPPRTEQNAGDSDATLWFSGYYDGDSRGYACTYRACRKFDRPIMSVVQHDFPTQDDFGKVADWIESKGINVLNVAGNRESKSPGIGDWVEHFLIGVFMELRARKELRQNAI